VRIFDPSSRMHAYFAPRGLSHIQLWHPEARVSVLTPSRLTCERYEVFPIEQWKRAASSEAEVCALLGEHLGLALPRMALLLSLQRQFAEPPRPSVEWA